MSTLVSAVEVASQEMARDPRSARTAESIAFTVRAIDEFLTTPPITLLRQLEPDAKAAIVPSIADKVRQLIGGLRDMLSVAAQTERLSGPISWLPQLAEAIRRLEAEFDYVSNISSRQSPPPVVRGTDGPPEQWRVEEAGKVYSTPPSAPAPSADESLDDILEDTMDLIRAQHTEAMSMLRGEQPLDWEVVRRRLDELDKLDD